MRIGIIRPGEELRTAEIESDDEGSYLSALQALVGGRIEFFDVMFGDEPALIVNDDGIFEGLTPNRAIWATKEMEEVGYLSQLDYIARNITDRPCPIYKQSRVRDVHDDHIQKMLDEKNLKHSECVMYRTVSNDFTPDEKFDYDMLVFFSPAGIQSLRKNFPEFNQGDIRIACFGPATAKAASDAGLRLDLEAPTVKMPSMPSALDLYLSENEK